MQILLSAIISYLVGSVSSAILVSKLLRLQDPRDAGSGNPGATNVLRLSGKIPAALTLLGDVAKGTLPVVVASAITQDSVSVAVAALAAFLGHLYPVYFQFAGGKGVATAIGVYLGLSLPSLPWRSWCMAYNCTDKPLFVAVIDTCQCCPLHF